MAPIRVACRRHDWSNALFDGRVATPSLTFQPEAHLRLDALLGDPPRVDFMEIGLVTHVQQRIAGTPIRALPVFLRAAFRHSYIFVNAAAGIAKPADLEGRRVGTRYDMTANLWARALLQHQYGVRLERIGWVEGRDPRELCAQLEAGAIDALVHPDVIPTKLLASGTVRRLFADPRAESRAYYRTTKVVPVMNAIAFRTADLERRPEAVAEVYGAFLRAKALGLEAMQDVRDSGLLWNQEALEAQIALLGLDPVPFSVAGMRPTLEALVRHGVEQGVFVRSIGLDELFYEPAG